MPPLSEYTISAPLPEAELRQLIHVAYGSDESTAMLSQVSIITDVSLGAVDLEARAS